MITLKRLYYSVTLISLIFCGTLVCGVQGKVLASQNRTNKIQTEVTPEKLSPYINEKGIYPQNEHPKPLPLGKGIKTLKIGEGLTPLPKTTDTKNGIPGLEKLKPYNNLPNSENKTK